MMICFCEDMLHKLYSQDRQGTEEFTGGGFRILLMSNGELMVTTAMR